ncbi:ABC transporter substrate-binding protein [Anaerobium acetethylicum]|uniref:Putative ABC transport system substrate-binding protein n=1 Tax=Anaerobium acetethylicum TaxID=1619234 RepID=A0A1D3TVC8_9FIRM|nr:ABC transporter substrate-binding protein [Anaerobium acetethylicum]SCP98084.1 putative ABC transport system substrate-binding protein [Anaerobium acetethylicum]
MKKKFLAVLLCAAMTAVAATGCSGADNNGTKTETTKETTYTIGISQFAEHGSLDNCREGFLAGLAEEGIVEGENLKVTVENAQADTGIANQIAQNFVANKVDLICAIATPSAQSAYNAAKDADIPTIFTAVTDPVAAELADEDGNPAGNITGTSDKLPVEKQLAMIREILPEAKTIGILYNTSEVNSEAAIAEYEAAVGEFGFKLETVGVSAAADIPLATDSILEKVDCINNLTDNLVVSSLPTILAKASEKNIPVFGSEVEQVKIGCLASEGLDYYKLGMRTGKMAAAVLKGEKKAGEMPYEIIEESSLYFNSKVMENLGLEVSEDVIGRAAEKFTEISAE